MVGFYSGVDIVQDAIVKAKHSKRPYRLAWPASAYQLSFNKTAYQEARTALALNGGYLRVEGNRAIARIKISYPRHSYAPLIPIPGFGSIGVEEGLFWILQQEGWYHEGYVEWVAALSS